MGKRRELLRAILFSAFVPGPVWADADSPECKEITARIVQITGAGFDNFSPSGENVFLNHPLSEEISTFLRKSSPDWDISQLGQERLSQ